jgi:L-threonylcarbamoyladenylate synthase
VTTLSVDDEDEVADALRGGRVVALPTETVYGLAVDLSIPGVTAELFVLKGRPDSVALPVIVHDLDAALRLTDPSQREDLRHIGSKYWPGPLTVVVRRETSCEFQLGGDDRSIGLRVSSAQPLRALCERVGPLGVSSANRHGRPPCEDLSQLRAAFGEELVVVDGGSRRGAASTVVDLRGGHPVILREGPINLAEIEAALGR